MDITDLGRLLGDFVVAAIITGAMAWIVKSRLRARVGGECAGEAGRERQLNGYTGVAAILALGSALFAIVLDTASPLREQLQGLGMSVLLLHIIGLIAFRLAFRAVDPSQAPPTP